ncbi:MAG: Nramp family divalent metal transporter [Actinomycetota bacterium]|nr:Nramp family divalent metal transporter [Actinomycetota bacterium]
MKRKLALLGPAFLVGAWQFGPGNLTTSSSAGASLGYSLLWVIVVATIFMLVYTDMNIRIGLAAQGSSIETIKDKLGKAVGALTGIGIFLVALSFQVGNATGAGVGLSLLFGGSVGLWAVVVTLVGLGLVWTRNYYKSLEMVILGLVGLMLMTFVVTAFLSGPDWGEAARGFIPSLPGGQAGLLVVALIGTNFSVTAAFYAGYAIREKGTGRDRYRETTLTDTLAGVIAPGVMTILVIVAAAAVLQPQGATVESPADMARVLEPTIGPLASTIFALGFFGAAFSSLMMAATAGGSVLSDAFGWGNRLSSNRVKAAVTVVYLFGATVAVIFGSSPVQLIIIAQALTIFVVPFVGLILLWVANDNARMGQWANSSWQNVLGALGWLALLATAVRLVWVLFF